MTKKKHCFFFRKRNWNQTECMQGNGHGYQPQYCVFSARLLTIPLPLGYTHRYPLLPPLPPPPPPSSNSTMNNNYEVQLGKQYNLVVRKIRIKFIILSNLLNINHLFQLMFLYRVASFNFENVHR